MQLSTLLETKEAMRVCAYSLSRVQLFTTLWTVAHQAPLAMGFPRQEYWSGLPFFSPGDLPNVGIKPVSLVFPALQADSSPAEPSGKPCFESRFYFRAGGSLLSSTDKDTGTELSSYK